MRGLLFQSKVTSRLRKRRNPTWGELQTRQKTVQHWHLLPRPGSLAGTGFGSDLVVPRPHTAQEGMLKV